MKILLRSKHLTEALMNLRRSIPPINHIFAPSNHLHIATYSEKTVLLSSSFGTVTVAIEIPADIQRIGQVTIPMEHFYNICKTMDDNIITLEHNGINYCRFYSPELKGNIVSDYCQRNIDGFNYSESPGLFILTEKQLKSALQDVLPFIEEHTRGRYWMTCICLSRTENGDLEFSSAGFGHAAQTMLPVSNTLVQNIPLYAPSFATLPTLLKDVDSPVSCHIDSENQKILFAMQRLRMIFSVRMRQEPFPSMSHIYPEEYEVDLNIDTEKLFLALQALKLYSSQTEGNITFQLDDEGNLTLRADETGIGEISLSIPCTVAKYLPSFTMQINTSKLINVLNVIGTENVRMRVRIRNNHLVVLTPEDRTTKFLIIPG